MEFTRDRVLQPPVTASVEVLYDMKEERMIGVRVWIPLEIFFDHIS